MLCKEFFRLLFVVANFLQFLKACTIPGISGNPGFLRLTVKDIHRGVFHRVTTSNILSITGSSHTGDPMQNGPYITAELDDNDLILSLHDNFEHYEEYETALSMGFTINFSCDGNPNTAIVVLTLNVEDTNNNKPIFTPPDVSFLIVPPLAPGFKITGCNNQIVVRDIDLTTTGIKFEIEENDYFEIAFDEESTIPNTKTFLGILRTKSIIRSIPNPISLQITATDIDNTNDPPLTSSTTVTIEGDPSFSLPDDLIFTEPFYLASYSADHEVNLKQKISLQEGFDDKVTFHLTGELGNHFRLRGAGNNLTIEVSTPLPESVFNEENQVLLVVTAERQHVSPTSATIVIELPRPKTIEFESLHYDARIVDNSLKAPNLVLAQGYEDGFDINIISDYSSNFQYEVVEKNQIRLQMTPLSDDILINNNFITLHVVASSGGSSATALVALDIIKDDLTTPMFEENTYIGAYNSEDGLNFEEIILVQGYDDTVNFDTEGEHGDFFTISSNDNRITLVPKIPTEALQSYNQLIFVIHATKPRTVGARSTVIVNLPSEEILRFANNHYMGLLEEGALVTEEIVLEEGYADDVNFNIFGDLQEHFLISNEANIVELKINPENEIPNNLDFIVLEIVANRPNIKSASTIIVIDIMSENKLIPIPMFRKIYYDGIYTSSNGLEFDHVIDLEHGYDEHVSFTLDRDAPNWFEISNNGNDVQLLVPNGIPMDVLKNNTHFTFSIIATRVDTLPGRTAVVIALPDTSELTILKFQKRHYSGSLQDHELNIEGIVLSKGHNEHISFEFSGEHQSFFQLNTNNAPVLYLELIESIPETLDTLILLEIRAFGPNAVTAFTTVVLETPAQVAVDVLTFSEAYYSGSYTQEDGLDFTDIIKLSSGYDDSVIFDLDGTHSEYFKINRDGNSVTLLVIPDGIPISVLNNNQHLTLSIMADRPGAVTGRAAIVISLPDEFPNITILQFEHTTYRGFVEENELSLGPIILQDGFSENINFELSGEHYSMFSLNTDHAPSLSLELMNPIPESLDELILLEIRAFGPNAATAFTTVVLETPAQVAVDVLTFSEAYYSGSYTQEDGLDFTDIIKLSSGYDDSVIFDLDGTHSEYFKINRDGNSVTLLVIPDGIPISVLNNNQHLTLSIMADRPGAVTGRAAIVISLPDGPPTDVFFMSALYRGSLELGVLRHDDITLVGYTGSEIEIYGEWSHLFTALVIDEDVTIKAVEDIIVPTEVQHIAFELRADVARTAITISIEHRDVTIPPEVEFRPTSYVFRVDITETGIIGIVTAIANNGENVEFSLEIDNEHLAERLGVNSQGELQLSAPANSGRYHFNVIATTIASGVSATANAQLTVDAITVCGEDEFVLPPLIVIERDEEEAHDDLVVVNDDIVEKCYFEMVNHWPIDQSWLTVNNTGLHAKSIDREDRSIAFMTVSQIQVELILHCADDNVKRTRRSVLNNNSNVSKTITPFEYGPKRWVLAESILYNSRRSFVNLIVKDINDHYPIFIGKENEPIVVGYPKLDLVDVIRPRALAELKATDKDIDMNAKLLYWSNEPVLAVAGETGRVHVRNNMAHLLEDNAEYVVSATDKAGAEDGKVGSVKILVKLLDINNIAVLTIRDAFMDSEQAVLRELSKNLNYDVRPLRSTVISSEFKESKQAYQIKHDIKRESITNSSGASLQLYVYGLVDRMPITASQLLTDINNSGITTIQIVDSVILEDHIANSDCRINIGLFAATITLSIILFLIIVFAVFWYFYKIRKFNNYEQFSDTKSLSTHSNDDSEIRKVEGIARAKINIDEIKKSERRLQEILNTPVEDTNITPQSNKDISTETIIDIPVVEKNAPIVIQSIDKLKDANDSSDEEDEFGEIKNSPKRRKSVVTFNENVEKIIHVEDDIDDTDSVPDFEVDKL